MKTVRKRCERCGFKAWMPEDRKPAICDHCLRADEQRRDREETLREHPELLKDMQGWQG